MLEKLLNIVIPGDRSSVEVDHERFSECKDKTKPKLVRLCLSSGIIKRKFLNNLKRLKGLDDFNGVSVTKDLTKQQRQERKSNPHNTRSKTKNPGNAKGPPSKNVCTPKVQKDQQQNRQKDQPDATTGMEVK